MKSSKPSFVNAFWLDLSVFQQYSCSVSAGCSPPLWSAANQGCNYVVWAQCRSDKSAQQQRSPILHLRKMWQTVIIFERANHFPRINIQDRNFEHILFSQSESEYPVNQRRQHVPRWFQCFRNWWHNQLVKSGDTPLQFYVKKFYSNPVCWHKLGV